MTIVEKKCDIHLVLGILGDGRRVQRECVDDGGQATIHLSMPLFGGYQPCYTYKRRAYFLSIPTRTRASDGANVLNSTCLSNVVND